MLRVCFIVRYILKQIDRLHAQGFSQNHIITTVFGIKKGSSKAYNEAHAVHQQAIEAIMVGDADEVEDEADDLGRHQRCTRVSSVRT